MIDVKKLYDEWKESSAGNEAFENARENNPLYNDGDHHTDSAVMDVIAAFRSWLEEEHGFEMEVAGKDEEYVCEDVWASFT